jgi:hypothetical protein
MMATYIFRRLEKFVLQQEFQVEADTLDEAEATLTDADDEFLDDIVGLHKLETQGKVDNQEILHESIDRIEFDPAMDGKDRV